MRHMSEAARKQGFNIHAIVFVPTMVVLTIVNVVVGRPWWILWVLLGWGIGLLMHWWFVVGPGAGRTGAQ